MNHSALLAYALLMSIGVLVVRPSEAHAATYYVCDEGEGCNSGAGAGWSTGDDSHSLAEAQSRATPWKTIDHAEENVSPGDTVIVGDGVYTSRSNEHEDTILHIATSGTAEAPITFRSENEWGAVIEGASLAGVWFECRATPPVSYVRVLDFEVREIGYVGIWARDSSTAPYTRCSNLEVRGNHVHGISHSGISLEATDDSLVADNRIDDIRRVDPELVNQYHGIYLSDITDNIRVENNLVFDVPFGWPVHIYDGHGKGPATNHTIVNNTLVNTNEHRSGGIVAFGSGHVIRNNILWEAVANERTYAIADQPGAVHAADHNITNLPTLCAMGCADAVLSANDLGADLDGEFVDASSGDYSLAESAASIDLGSAEDAPMSDIVGTERPQGDAFDLGAYELRQAVPMADAGPDAALMDSGTGSLDAGQTDATVDATLGDARVADAGPAAPGSGGACTVGEENHAMAWWLFCVAWLALRRSN